LQWLATPPDAEKRAAGTIMFARYRAIKCDGAMLERQHDKPRAAPNYLKRRTFLEGKALIDAAHVATRRLYCDVLAFWRRCRRRSCRRHRACRGDASRCFVRGVIHVAPSRRIRAQEQVIAGGPRRLPPASHIEWQVRRNDFVSLARREIGIERADR
jgi:hypothetical protein